MMHHTIVKEQLSDYFKVSPDEVIVIDRLKGGMSNSNYIASIHHQLYTFRIPGKNAFVFVNRQLEQYILELIRPLQIDGNALIHMSVENGYKISRYMEGTPLMQLVPADYYEEVASLLHQLHDSTLECIYDYAPFERLANYEQLVHEVGLAHEATYYEIRDKFFSQKVRLQQVLKVLCHNDSQPSNFIDTGDKVVLVDWEFGGNNDYLYDIACYGNFDFNLALGLLPVYLDRNPTKDELERLYLWRTFQCLQWHNVALYKEAIGLSAELHLDFKQIATNYIIKANALFEGYLHL
jgi:thiamine kinase-like enzyme